MKPSELRIGNLITEENNKIFELLSVSNKGLTVMRGVILKEICSRYK